MRTAPVVALMLLGACSMDPAPGDDTPANAIGLEHASAFWLPINSERLGASGLAASADVCVGLVWDFSNLDKPRTNHCDDFGGGFPYAVITPATSGCDAVWGYTGNAELVSITGCIEPSFDEVSIPSGVDVTAEVSGELFTGVVHLATP